MSETKELTPEQAIKAIKRGKTVLERDGCEVFVVTIDGQEMLALAMYPFATHPDYPLTLKKAERRVKPRTKK